MENEEMDILERDDRSNDLDDINLEEFNFKDVGDFGSYLKDLKKKISDDENQEVGKRSRKKGRGPGRKPGSGKKKNVVPEGGSDADYRSTLIAFMTTEDIRIAIRVIAGLYGQTVSSLINDSIKAYLKNEIDKVLASDLLKEFERRDDNG